MYIEKTTVHERIAISNAMTPIFFDLERAESLLDSVQNECFEGNGKSVHLAADAKWTWDMIGLVDDILRNAITAFHLTIANTFDDGAKYYLNDAKCAETAMKVEKALDRISDIERGLPEDRCKSVSETVGKAVKMEDEEALPILEALIKEHGEHNG